MIAYKYRSGRGLLDSCGNDIFERDIKLLSQDTIYIPTIEQLNDPSEALFDDHIFQTQINIFKPFVSLEAVKNIQDSLRDLYQKVRTSGIYSLSREPANELMWAYYASGHTGYAIIIDTSILAKSFELGTWGGMYEVDVKYSTKLPHFDISRLYKNIENTLSCLVGTKSKAWEHEAEHRLLFENGGKCLRIDYRAIKGFVFGCRMADEDIDYVMKTFAGRDLSYFKVEHKDDSYELSLEVLKDKYPTDVKYCPNKVDYDIEELLESDKFIGGVGYKYRPFVEAALEEVCREPFVIQISHIVVSDDNRYPHLLIWTKVDQDGAIRKMRSFEYDVVDGTLLMVVKRQRH